MSFSGLFEMLITGLFTLSINGSFDASTQVESNKLWKGHQQIARARSLKITEFEEETLNCKA